MISSITWNRNDTNYQNPPIRTKKVRIHRKKLQIVRNLYSNVCILLIEFIVVKIIVVKHQNKIKKLNETLLENLRLNERYNYIFMFWLYSYINIKQEIKSSHKHLCLLIKLFILDTI